MNHNGRLDTTNSEIKYMYLNTVFNVLFRVAIHSIYRPAEITLKSLCFGYA